jgi:tetratricopeptide (TPR) repeat protein
VPPPLPTIKNTPVLPPAQVAQAVPVPPLPSPAVVPPPKSVIAPPQKIVIAPPQVTPLPLPKVAAAVPAPQITTAVPTPQMAPLPLPIMPQVAVVTPKPPAVLLAQKPTQIAALPKREIPAPTPFAPEIVPPAAPLDAPKPLPLATVKKRAVKAEDMTAIEPLLAKGDSALDGGDAVGAIAFYRQAINGAPLSVVPRLKLAQAYQKDGLNDRALDEARRALEIAPDSLPVQQFLSDLDQQTGTTAGSLVRDRAALERSPGDPAAHAALADALWNNGDLSGAEAEYKASAALAPVGSHLADAQLAQLYAAEARYGDCLAILQSGGKGSYAVAIQIVKNRADTLSSTLASSRETFAAGKSTREQFYDDAKKLSAQAQALAEFVAEVTPPAQYKLSHLHRILSTNLLAQESAALVSFIETGDTRQNDTISQLERAAATEMLTAQATEEKLGLWKEKPPTD